MNIVTFATYIFQKDGIMTNTLAVMQSGTVWKLTLFMSLQLLNHAFRQVLNKYELLLDSNTDE